VKQKSHRQISGGGFLRNIASKGVFATSLLIRLLSPKMTILPRKSSGS